MSFESLNLIAPLLKALKEENYEQPTPIQAQAIPHVLDGRDIFGAAQTGTGKTAAFTLPILQLLSAQPAAHNRPIRTLILAPTRELAIQIDESIKSYGRHLNLRNAVIFGGVPQRPQTEALRKGVDILVATPGRLIDLINQRFVSLKHLEILVLDEADRMLDMGFIHDVRRIIALVPPKRQNLLFSATLPKEIKELISKILHNPVHIEVVPASTTAERIEQELYYVSKENKKDLLHHLVVNGGIKRVLVFSRTKHGADKVVKDLNKRGVAAAAIHGNKSQNARQRSLSDFKDNKIQVLIATDIAARGIDVDELTHVINYDLPDTPETYVHRIGRTGRAGSSGRAWSFCSDEELDELKDILKHLKQDLPVNAKHPFHIDLKTPSSNSGGRQNQAGRPNQGSKPKPGGGGRNSRPSNHRKGNNSSGAKSKNPRWAEKKATGAVAPR